MAVNITEEQRKNFQNNYNQIKKIIKQISPDVVHTHNSKAGVIGRFAAWLSRTKLIIHTIHTLPFISANFFTKIVYLVLEKITSFITDEFINVSKGTMEIYLKYKIGRLSNHHVIYSAFDIREGDDIANINPYPGSALDDLLSPQFYPFVTNNFMKII